MNSKFLVLTAFIFFNFGCAHSADVAKTDMPEDEMIAAAPIIEKTQPNQNSRAPASTEEEGSCQKHGKKNSCNH